MTGMTGCRVPYKGQIVEIKGTNCRDKRGQIVEIKGTNCRDKRTYIYLTYINLLGIIKGTKERR